MVSVTFLPISLAPLQNYLISLCEPIEDNETFIFYDDQTHITIAHLLYLAGLYPSLTRARKDGWGKPLPESICEPFLFGKNKSEVWIQRPSPDSILTKIASRVYLRQLNKKAL